MRRGWSRRSSVAGGGRTWRIDPQGRAHGRAQRRAGTLALAVLALALGAAAPSPAEIYATGNAAVLVFGDGADGDTAPYHVISGANTDLAGASSLALDLIHRELFVSSWYGRIMVFDLDDDGDVAPKREITGSNTGFGQSAGMAIDPVNDLLYVADLTNDRVAVFARDADGDVAPIRTIEGSNTTLDSPIEALPRPRARRALRLHPRLHHHREDGDRLRSRPNRQRRDQRRGAEAPADRRLDPARQPARHGDRALAADGLIVSDRNGAIRFYARDAANDTAPVKNITGASTNVYAPYDLVLRRSDEILVGNDGSPDSTVVGHALTASGDATPVRVLAGDSTLLEYSNGIATDRAKYCSEGNAVDGCLFRDNFESAGVCYWSSVTGGPACF